MFIMTVIQAFYKAEPVICPNSKVVSDEKDDWYGFIKSLDHCHNDWNWQLLGRLDVLFLQNTIGSGLVFGLIAK